GPILPPSREPASMRAMIVHALPRQPSRQAEMVARIRTVAFEAGDVRPLEALGQVTGGMPAFTLAGLRAKAVGESRERVRAALTAIGLALPHKRLTVNLAPADLLKEGSHFDLPIALGLLAAMGVIEASALDAYVVLGE